MTNVQFLWIDNQNDFCDPAGALFVPGAQFDAIKSARAVTWSIKAQVEDIDLHCEHTATMDQHHPLHIAHACMWRDKHGNNPKPFTEITVDDVDSGKWQAGYPSMQTKLAEYVHALKANQRYTLTIWPEHCIIGDWGAGLHPAFRHELRQFEYATGRPINYKIKGQNLFTESYSAIRADVIDELDESTWMDRNLIERLGNADRVIFGGQALSHCVANTIEDALYELKRLYDVDFTQRCVLLRDTTSPVDVPIFHQMAEVFVKKMESEGMIIADVADLDDIIF